MPGTRGKGTVRLHDIPDTIHDTPDSFSKETLACINCGKNYRILAQELAFYRKIKEAVPRKCPDCRHASRTQIRNPHKLWRRQCMCEKADHGHAGRCQTKFETTYAPDRPELVYCEQCYQKEVV